MIDDRIDEQLRTRREDGTITCHQRGRCRQISAGTVTADRDRSLPDPQCLHMSQCPQIGSETLFRRQWKRVLRRQMITDEQDLAWRMGCIGHGQRIMIRRCLQDKPAAVKIDECRQRIVFLHRFDQLCFDGMYALSDHDPVKGHACLLW